MVDTRPVATPRYRHLDGNGAPSEAGRDSRAGSLSPDTEVAERRATDADIDRLGVALARLLAEWWRRQLDKEEAPRARGAAGGR